MAHRTGRARLAAVSALLLIMAVAAALSGCCEIAPIPKSGVSVENTIVIPSGEPTFSAEGTVTTPESDGDGIESQDFGNFNTASAGGTKEQLPGPSKATVPNVVGLSLSAAKSRIQAAGFRYFAIQRPDLPKGTVYEQWPRAGTVQDTGLDVQVVHGAN
jgi:hypothetical protein